MLDLRWIRDHPKELDRLLQRRGEPARADEVLALDAAHREEQTRLQELQTERNRLSKEVGAAKAKGGDAAPLIQRVAALKDVMGRREGGAREKAEAVEALLATVPNVLHAAVPDGADESANVEARRHGEPRSFDFAVRDHAAIGEGLGMMDFAAAARMSGARFVVLKGLLARLERALAAFMLDLQTGENGYTEVHPPHLVHYDALFGTGQLPKFRDDLFSTTELEPDSLSAAFEKGIPAGSGTVLDVFGAVQEIIRRENASREGQARWLIPTAEVPLTNLVREQILAEADLPLRWTAYTPCYRAEAGAAGKDTHGMIRQHQFTKVELVSVVHPPESGQELERMTRCAEEVLKRLELPYRVIELCAGDLGFAAARTYDLEVWLPAQKRYREVSSCSDCGDFQARRMNARFRPAGGEKGTSFVHTLNGSGLAVGRTLVAVLENYQNADGSVTVPQALRMYMGGLEALLPGDGS